MAMFEDGEFVFSKTLEGHKNDVKCVTVLRNSANQDVIISGSRDRGIFLWEPE